ncbi:hypothetical protein ACVC7O_12940 [Roseobacter sp. A03A-229]
MENSTPAPTVPDPLVGSTKNAPPARKSKSSPIKVAAELMLGTVNASPNARAPVLKKVILTHLPKYGEILLTGGPNVKLLGRRNSLKIGQIHDFHKYFPKPIRALNSGGKMPIAATVPG